MKNNPLDFRPNTLYRGDCLDVMQCWPEGCVDLIYLDPPFNSNATYAILFGKRPAGKPRGEHARFMAFNDTWYWSDAAAARVQRLKLAVDHAAHQAMRGLAEMLPAGGMLAYLSYMAERIAAMHRLLTDTGSFYLHCDPSASHYLKAIVDCVFGAQNFRNEIVWHYGAGHPPKKDFARKHDVIFRYTKTSDYVFNSSSKNMRIPFKPIATKMHFTKVDATGRQYRQYASGKIAYLDAGKVVTDVWTDIDGQQARSPISKEYLGYPTQKPLALLERIVAASSNAGDLVLDPFCGCGTTLQAAWNLKRAFIGIDISPYAITRMCQARLKNATGVALRGLPTDLESARALAKSNPHVFEQWAVTCLPGFEPNDKHSSDGGIDGRGFLLYPPDNKAGEQEKGRCIAQVKGGTVSPDAIRALLAPIASGYASMVILITLDKIDTPTLREAIGAAGTFPLKDGAQTFNRMTCWSIAEYFAPVEPKLPPMAHPRTGRRNCSVVVGG